MLKNIKLIFFLEYEGFWVKMGKEQLGAILCFLKVLQLKFEEGKTSSSGKGNDTRMLKRG